MLSFTVATLNINAWRDHWLKRRGLIVSEILEAAPDLIGLQEVYRLFEEARWLRNQINSRLTGRSREPYRLIQRRKRSLASGLFAGIAVMTKLPVLSHDHLALGYGGCTALRVNVELPTREGLDFVTVQLADEPSAAEVRLEQVLQLQGWLQGRDIAPKQVIGGDFGTDPMGLSIRQMKQAYRSAFHEARGSELIATYPTALASTIGEVSACRDYIFLSKSLGKVVDARIFCQRPAKEDPQLFPSNHVGLLAEIEINR